MMREMNRNRKTEKYDKKWVDNVMKNMKSDKYEHPEVMIESNIARSPKLKLKSGFDDGRRRRSSLFKPVKSLFL